ncbi:hypothetical protein EIP86_011567 [Pleurotus ostreatoroseus]|nr:hypothetical protein EIP86_011567 [Pleurotus ostreatoroseus]
MDNPADGDLEAGDDERYPDEGPELSYGDIPALGRTAAFRNFLESLGTEAIIQRCEQAIDYLAEQLNLDLTLLLYYCTSWTVPEATANAKIQYARTALMWSQELPVILKNWHKPPRRHNAGICTRAARSALDSLAEDVIKRRINTEMRTIAPFMRAPPDEVKAANIMFDIEDMIDTVKVAAPTFWTILRSAFYTPAQDERNVLKDPDLSILTAVASASFSRSHHRCKYQKLMGIYFKACGTAARGIDTLSSLGMSMSQTWIYDGIKAISVAARDEMRDAISKYPWTGGHDNINIRRKAYQQRLDNLSQFDSGTLATIFVHKAPDAVMPNNRAYWDKFAIGSKNPITPIDLFKLEQDASPRLREQAVYFILRMLVDADPFDFATYEHKDSDIFSRPPSVFQLPVGPEYVTLQYMLDAAHIEEASYEGNEACFEEWWRQLGITSIEDKRRMGRDKLIPWKGDQLTISRVRGIKRFHSQDLNAWEQWLHILETFGWFHAYVTICHSFHNQYYGTSASMGLRHAFNILKRTGLAAPSTQGNFPQMISEALLHVADAHFRDAWCTAAEVDNISDLRTRAPEQLRELANEIFDNYASTAALNKQRAHLRDMQDDLLIQTIMFNRDILDFVNLDDAIRIGDVGRMKDLLPRLLFRYIGGGHTNYTIEFLETIQGLEREWPEDLIVYVLRFCWLGNASGRPDSFLPFDEFMEHNILDTKDTFATLGPSTSWEYLKKTTASIPTQRRIKDHVEAHINHFRRGKSHTNPKKEGDVAMLQAMYARAKIHSYHRSRQLPKESRTEDFIAKGSDPSTLRKTIKKWQEKRVIAKGTKEDWEFGYGENVATTTSTTSEEAMQVDV